MTRIRRIMALFFLLLLGMFMFYVAELSRGQSDRDGDRVALRGPVEPRAKGSDKSPAPPALPVPAPPPEALTESLQCIECHSEIYAEWKTDQHATAWTGDTFRDFTNRYKQVECLSCHAPQPMLEVGIKNEPKLREAGRADGVECFACHMKNGKSHGTLGSGALCGGILEPALKTAQACYHCHSQHNLFKEYLDSPQYKEGKSCQDCHMSQVVRPVADGGPIRQTRMHVMQAGGHDREALKTVLELELKKEGAEFTVTVTNVGAAHGVPGEINNRVIRLEISVLTQKGTDRIKDVNAEGVEEVWADQVLFQAPPRLSRNIIPSTQIMPGEPRVLKWPFGAPHGKVIASLSYKLEKTNLNSDATPMVTRDLDF